MTFLSTRELYALFLDSHWWRSLSRKAKEAAGWECEKCPSQRDLQTHHLRYPENWFDATLDDLQVLCRACHRKTHKIRKPLWAVALKRYRKKDRKEERALRQF